MDSWQKANGMRAEVHGGGLANLNLALALPNNTYYEDLVIDVQDIKSRRHGPMPFNNGMVSLPEGSVGVGWNLDIADIEARSIETIRVEA